MYSVWFVDLQKAIEVFMLKTHHFTFCSIEGNAHGDFVIKTANDTWIVKHNDFSVWHLEPGKYKWGDWIEVV